MDRRVAAYLLSSKKTKPSHYSQRKNESLFILETRECFWLEHIIAHALHEFPGWQLYVCAPPRVLSYLCPKFPTVKPVVVDLPARCSPAAFSSLMFSSDLWSIFDTEYVMIFQCDAVFAPDAISKIPTSGKDFYGAVCGPLDPDSFVINGGLSLRKVSAFKKAVALLTDEDRTEPEDVAFCNVMRRHPDTFQLPTLHECLQFAIESFGIPSTAVGIHGVDKSYAPPALLTAVLGSENRVVDCWMYDGEPIAEARMKLLDSIVDAFVVVESKYSHSGEPRELCFPYRNHPKVRYVVIDDFPPAPDKFGEAWPWVKGNVDSWWRECFQRDALVQAVKPGERVIVSDVDELPDPSVVADLDVSKGPVHLQMAFLVWSPKWEKKSEPWAKAFVCAAEHFANASPTAIRVGAPEVVYPDAGWHCTSFFDVEAQIRKINHFAHREHAGETQRDVVLRRQRLGKDPYGREGHDCEETDRHLWLSCILPPQK